MANGWLDGLLRPPAGSLVTITVAPSGTGRSRGIATAPPPANRPAGSGAPSAAIQASYVRPFPAEARFLSTRAASPFGATTRVPRVKEIVRDPGWARICATRSCRARLDSLRSSLLERVPAQMPRPIAVQAATAAIAATGLIQRG